MMKVLHMACFMGAVQSSDALWTLLVRDNHAKCNVVNGEVFSWGHTYIRRKDFE